MRRGRNRCCRPILSRSFLQKKPPRFKPNFLTGGVVSTIPPVLYLGKLIELKKQVEGVSQARLQRFLASARRTVRLDGKVSVLLTSNREMRQLNRKFRGKDKPTDVISFPAVDVVSAKFAGDLAISLDIAAANARALGHSTEDELRVLILHGLLHLAGHDHETDSGQMGRKEARLRKLLGLPSSLIARTGGNPAVAAQRTPKRNTRQRRGR